MDNSSETLFDALGALYQGVETWTTYIYDIGILQQLSAKCTSLSRWAQRELSPALLLDYMPSLPGRREALEDNWEIVDK